MRLKDKVCIITGGGSGIGRATALLFAGEGARLVVADKHAANAQAVASQCASKGAQAIAIMADVASTADVKRMIAATTERFRRLDVLVNNAGYGIPGSVVETDEDAWDALMAVNVRGVFLCSKYAIPVMKTNGGGAIVNTASVVAAVGIGNRAAYCASKGAVAALTRAIAIDHVGDGIRCNAIAPGTIDTPYFDDILRKSPDPGATRKALAARQLLGRLGTPEEIAAGILFLASDESRFATGTILTLDGGMTSRLLAASDSHYDACGSIAQGVICANIATQRRIVCRATSPKCWPALRHRCNTTIFPQRSESTARTSCSIRWRVRSPGTGARRRNSSPRSRRDWHNPRRAASSAARRCRSAARHFSMVISSPRSPCATCTARR